MFKPHGAHRARMLGVAALSVCTALLGTPATLAAPAQPAPASAGPATQGTVEGARQGEVVTASMKEATGTVTAYVELAGQGAYGLALDGGGRRVSPMSQASPTAQSVAAAHHVQSQVVTNAQSLAASSNSQVLYTTHNLQRGVALTGDAQAIRDLAGHPDVVRISRIVPKERMNAISVVGTGALEAWRSTGATGRGVTIAVIDTGLDYTHADFGGPGTKAAYDKAKSSPTMPVGSYDQQKVVGGYDLVGDAYNGYNAPAPDSNPMDCSESGHGTHVAGTAAGYGVGADGKTFRGEYSKLSSADVQRLHIGPGSAPEARLMPLRIFGCSGSSSMTGQALDRALDPNNDGDFSDGANIVNLSLGSDYSTVDDPENTMLQRLIDKGVLAVVAAGNAQANLSQGDVYSIMGAPANNPSALTVANSDSSLTRSDRFEVKGPSAVAGAYAGSYSTLYTFASNNARVSGTVTAAPESNKTGCAPFTGTNFGGRWVMLHWEASGSDASCDSARRFANVAAANGKGVLMVAPENDDRPIAGSTTIPGVLISRATAQTLYPAVKAGTLEVELGAAWRNTALTAKGPDTLAASSARGVHGSDGFVKPDVVAPGTNIYSAGAGSGNQPFRLSGTSMATPHVAGIAAQILSKEPFLSQQQVKARIMNTASQEVRTVSGERLGVDRVGAGRVDAQAAVNERTTAYNTQNPQQVSLSFGVIEVTPGTGAKTVTKEVTVENAGGQQRTFRVGFDARTTTAGVQVKTPESVSVAAGAKATFRVSVTVDPEKLAKTLDAGTARDQGGRYRQYLSSVSGNVILTDSSSTVVVPLHAAPKPVSELMAPSASLTFGTSQTARIKPEGTPVRHNGYVSQLGAFELGYEESGPAPGSSSARAMAVQYVGASSNLPALGASGSSQGRGVISFGVATRGNWDALTPAYGIEVEIDTDSDGYADYSVQVKRQIGLDYPVAVLSSRRAGASREVDALPVNGVWGDIDTNTFDTNVAVIPVAASSLGLTRQGSEPLQYRVLTSLPLLGQTVSETDWVSFNPYTPNLWFDGGQGTGPSLFVDSPDAPVTAHLRSGASAKMLLLHLHNPSASAAQNTSQAASARVQRAQVLEARSGSAGPSNPAPAPPASHRFRDVGPAHPFYTEIEWLAGERITRGWPDGTYRPGENIERGAIAAYFYRMAGAPDFTPPVVSPFKDVDPSHPFYREITWLASKGITRGWGDGTFRPHEPVSREAMAAFFYRYANSPQFNAPQQSPFRDVRPSDPFYREITWLASKGITRGWSDGTFRPVEPIHRDAMAAFVYRFRGMK